MKKVSAFTVFNAKKKEKDGLPPSGIEDKTSMPLRKAHSSQSMERSGKKDQGSGSKSKRFFVNIRESMRLSGKRRRSSLTSVNSNSPMTALKQISLVGPKESKEEKPKARKRILDSKEQVDKLETTPLSRRSPKGLKKPRTPRLPRTKSQTSATSLSLFNPTPRVTTPSTTDSARNLLGQEEGVDTSAKKKGKRRSESKSPRSDSKKKKKIENGEVKVVKAKRDRASLVPYMYDSTQEGCKMFECIIHPVKTERFFSELWEKKPLLVKRHLKDYNKGWFSTAEFDKILRQENIQWGVNLDATSFVKDKRETHNLSGRAYAPVVWDMYQAGCSMRMLNPQTYSKNVWKVLSLLQEYFCCCVGANVYLTPAGTQGFAPHYDDIEAFIIQLEGKKHWRLYSPRNDEELLPRFSSGNFSQADMGEPILDTVLEAGDMLYFPRGTIHQGNATEEHSLHITVSCYQLNTWGDLLQKVLPTALDQAIEENPEFRTGLPRDYLNYMGIVHSEKELPERKQFVEKIQSLVLSMLGNLPIDAACDQMGKQLMHDSMPPVLSEVEKSCSVHGAGERWDAGRMQVMGVSEIQPTTEVKLIRRGVLRLLTEDDKVHVYYSVENARVYRASGPNFFEITPEMAPAVEFLINAYPEFVSVESLPLENLTDQLNIVSCLYERSLLITSEPLETTFDEPGDETEDDVI